MNIMATPVSCLYDVIKTQSLYPGATTVLLETNKLLLPSNNPSHTKNKFNLFFPL